MEDLKELTKQNYERLPEELKKAVLDPNLKSQLEKIALQYELSDGQLRALKNETYFVLLGIERLSNYSRNLREQTGINPGRAVLVAQEVIDNIFRPVEDTLDALERIIDQPKKNLEEKKYPEKINREPDKKYGIEPAKDLGTEDFEWRGNVGGVEIEENKLSQEETSEENLDKTKILEEIEHPPVYVPKTNLEEKMDRSSWETKEKETEEAHSGPTKNVEEKRKVKYRGEDPYREPVE